MKYENKYLKLKINNRVEIRVKSESIQKIRINYYNNKQNIKNSKISKEINMSFKSNKMKSIIKNDF